jgi:hypothetical protein
MAGKESKLTVWALDPEITLEIIPELLQLDYSKDIEYLSDIDVQINEFDRKLFHRWRAYREDQGFNIQSKEILGLSIRSIAAYAFLESPAPKDQAVIGSFVLPRERRVSWTELPVFFFEYMRRVYVIIEGSEYKVRYIRSALMGGGRNPNEQHTRWKKIQFKDIPNYNFSSDFFYWLISKQNTTVSTTLVNMDVSDIRYLAQSADRKDVRHESEGDNLLDGAMSKTGLGVNSRVGQVGTTITWTGATLRFILFESGNCYVDNYLSSINSATGEIEPFESYLDTGALMLYAIILPELKTAFNQEKDGNLWTTQHQAESRKTWALGAINELCSENDISIEEIKDLDWFK